MKSLKTPFLIATASMLLTVGVSVSSANASQPKSLASAASASGIISNGYNFCLGLGTVQLGNPTLPVVNSSCSAMPAVVTKSIKSNGYTIAIGGKCLIVPKLANGSDLFAGFCGLAADWFALPAGGIGLVNSNFCLDVEVGVPKIGSPIQIYTCQGLTAGLRIPAQRWTYPKALFDQSPYPYPDKTIPQPLPVSPTSTPKTCNNVGMCTAEDVLQRIRLVTSVKDRVDPSLPKPSFIKWNTEEPWYGKEANRPSCATDSFDYQNTDATNFALSSQRNDRSWELASVIGTMFRVRNGPLKFINGRLYGGFLKSVTVQTTYEGLCQKFLADANGWIIIPRYCNYCILYGFKPGDWPKNSIVEVAEISANGRGGFSTVTVKNPRKVGPSRATCIAITVLGTTKETLKFATEQVAGALPPPANLVVPIAISLFFEKIDIKNDEPPLTKTIATFGKADKALELFNYLNKVDGARPEILKGAKVAFYSTALDFGNLVAGHYSVYTKKKQICG